MPTIRRIVFEREIKKKMCFDITNIITVLSLYKTRSVRVRFFPTLGYFIMSLVYDGHAVSLDLMLRNVLKF